MRRNSDRPACVATRQRPEGSIDALLQISAEHGQMLGVAIGCGWFLAVFHTVHLLSTSYQNWLYSVERIETGETVDSNRQ
jgi:hypothetical protein